MSFYTVSTVPPESLSKAELGREIDEIKAELVTIENSLATKKAWAAADGKSESPDYIVWVARSRDFRKKLVVRYMALRPFWRRYNQESSHARR
jgi:hypothetical protein